MLDFAAGLLGELERWMLTASPAMVDLTTFADTSDKFQGQSTLLNDMQRRFPAGVDEVQICPAFHFLPGVSFCRADL